MANLKEVRSRIKSVTSTQQITKAMKLVSATKLRKSQGAIQQLRPYAVKLKGIMLNLGDSVDSQELSVYFDTPSEGQNLLMIVITSDRGLCGAFNANVCKLAKSLLTNEYFDLYNRGKLVMMPIGKKGYEYFQKDKKINFRIENREILQNLNSEDVFKAGDQIMELFKSGEFSKVILLYNQFKNAASQILVNEQLLPVIKNVEGNSLNSKNDYIFEPSKEGLLGELIPRSIKTQLYKACVDSFASEHGARMVAMDKATENAGELLKTLRLQYNQARQAAITKELSEIVGGAAAMNG